MIENEQKNGNYYKEILIPLSYKLETEEEEYLQNIFKKFSPNEIVCNIDDTQVKLLLHSIDIQQFKNELDKSKNGITTPEFCGLLDDIYSQINSIRSYGLKSNKRVYVGYNNERKVQNRKVKESNRQQYFYTENNTFSQNNNTLPLQFEDKIICGDSAEVLRKLPDNCIDLICTSPPYNFGMDYEANEDAHFWDNYFIKLFEIFNECIRVLKYGGRIIVNVQPLFSDYIPTHHIISNFFISNKLIWKGEIIWEKNNYNCKYTAWGSWKSPSNPYLKYTWEYLEIFAKGTLKKESNSQETDITADEFKKWVVAKWSIAPERKMKEFNHPAMFPEELVMRALKLFSYKNDIVLDPFNGVGTTSLVAHKLSRRYIGIDISKEYCERAENRLQSILF